MTKDEKNNFINVTSIDCILKYIDENSKATRKEILDNAIKSFIDKCAKNKMNGINKGSAGSFVGKALNDLLTGSKIFVIIKKIIDMTTLAKNLIFI